MNKEKIVIISSLDINTGEQEVLSSKVKLIEKDCKIKCDIDIHFIKWDQEPNSLIETLIKIIGKSSSYIIFMENLRYVSTLIDLVGDNMKILPTFFKIEKGAIVEIYTPNNIRYLKFDDINYALNYIGAIIKSFHNY
jgi:hypothetical protein